jgi:hypothetical protein
VKKSYVAITQRHFIRGSRESRVSREMLARSPTARCISHEKSSHFSVARNITLPAKITSGLGQRERGRAVIPTETLDLFERDILPTVLCANDPSEARGVAKGRGKPGQYVCHI